MQTPKLGADRFQLSAAEMSAIAASFNDKSETKAVIANGVKINGEKYMTIEASDDSLKAKKVRQPPRKIRATPD
jgi:profilin